MQIEKIAVVPHPFWFTGDKSEQPQLKKLQLFPKSEHPLSGC